MRLFALLAEFCHDEIEQEERVPHGGVLPSQAVEISAARRPEKIALGADAEGQRASHFVGQEGAAPRRRPRACWPMYLAGQSGQHCAGSVY